MVKFNPTTYANLNHMLEWLDKQLVSILEGQPTPFALDLFSGHKTEEGLAIFHDHNIILSVILSDCTSLVQPLDISINCLFKD